MMRDGTCEIVVADAKERVISDRDGAFGSGRFCRRRSCVHDPVSIFAYLATSFIDLYQRKNDLEISLKMSHIVP